MRRRCGSDGSAASSIRSIRRDVRMSDSNAAFTLVKFSPAAGGCEGHGTSLEIDCVLLVGD
jgi:hypothetical protein